MSPRSDQLGDAPIEARFQDQMNAVARGLDEVFNGKARGADRTIGFVLMVYEIGKASRCNYISNGADREDVVALMREMIARFEGRYVEDHRSPDRP